MITEKGKTKNTISKLEKENQIHYNKLQCFDRFKSTIKGPKTSAQHLNLKIPKQSPRQRTLSHLYFTKFYFNNYTYQEK